MAALSITTVVLSMVNDCPTLAFYILEFIINGAMILEVGIRFVAFGRVRAHASYCNRRYVVQPHPPSAAILEVTLEHNGFGLDRVLRDHATLHLLRRMRQHEQGGRTAGHVAARRT